MSCSYSFWFKVIFSVKGLLCQARCTDVYLGRKRTEQLGNYYLGLKHWSVSWREHLWLCSDPAGLLPSLFSNIVCSLPWGPLADDRSSNVSMATAKEGQHQDQWRPGQSTSKSVHMSRKWSHDIGFVFQTMRKKSREWNLLLGNLQLKPIHYPYPRGHLAVSETFYLDRLLFYSVEATDAAKHPAGHKTVFWPRLIQPSLGLRLRRPVTTTCETQEACRVRVRPPASRPAFLCSTLLPSKLQVLDTFWFSLLCGGLPRCVQNLLLSKAFSPLWHFWPSQEQIPDSWSQVCEMTVC